MSETSFFPVCCRQERRHYLFNHLWALLLQGSTQIYYICDATKSVGTNITFWSWLAFYLARLSPPN